MNEENTAKDEFKVSGDSFAKKIKGLFREANIRRVVVKNKDDKMLIQIPLIIGIIGAILLPTLTVIGVIVALVTKHTIVIRKREE